jgi:hypothetical protein
MLTPLSPFSHRLRSVARQGPKAFAAFTASDEFLMRLQRLPPELRHKGMLIWQGAAVIAAKADRRPPLIAPKPLGTSGKERNRWTDPAMQAKLAAAYRKAGADHEMAGRLMGVSPGAARQAFKTYLAPATPKLGKAA